jgi:hypothetical protein
MINQYRGVGQVLKFFQSRRFGIKNACFWLKIRLFNVNCGFQTQNV